MAQRRLGARSYVVRTADTSDRRVQFSWRASIFQTVDRMASQSTTKYWDIIIVQDGCITLIIIIVSIIHSKKIKNRKNGYQHYAAHYKPFQKNALPVSNSEASTIAKPIMAALEFSVSASGVNGPKASLFVEFKRGMSVAALNRMKVKMIPVGSSASWRRTDSPDPSSAPRAEMNPIMANLPLINSGAGPLKDMASPMLSPDSNSEASGSAGAGETLPVFTASVHCTMTQMHTLNVSIKPLNYQNS